MLLNFIIFNFAWFTLIFTANTYVYIVLLVVLGQYLVVSNKVAEAKLILTVSLIGISVDSLLMHSGVFTFPQNGTFIPLWLMVIWIAFASTLNHSLSFLSHRPYLQFFCGLIFPPLNYLTGHSFGAVAFTYSTSTTFIILSVIWAPLLMLFYYCQSSLFKKERNNAIQ